VVSLGGVNERGWRPYRACSRGRQYRYQFGRSAPDILFEGLRFFGFHFHNFAPFSKDITVADQRVSDKGHCRTCHSTVAPGL
jgi:hypothetical protein